MTTHMLEALFKAEHPAPSLADALKFICERWDQIQASDFELPGLDETDFECFYENREIPEELQERVLEDAPTIKLLDYLSERLETEHKNIYERFGAVCLENTPLPKLIEEIYERSSGEALYECFGSECLVQAPIDELLEAAYTALGNGEEPHPDRARQVRNALLP